MLKFSHFCTQTAEILLKFSSFFLSSAYIGFIIPVIYIVKNRKSNSNKNKRGIGVKGNYLEVGQADWLETRRYRGNLM